MFNPSNLNSVPHSDTLAINEISKQKIANGETVYRFGFGQSPFSPAKEIIDALSANAAEHDYLDVQGLKELREKIAEFHTSRETPLNADNIFVGPGSKMMLFALQASFKKAIVFLPAPCWVSYMPQAKILGHQHVFMETSYENKWRLQAEELESYVNSTDVDKDAQKILILTAPGNPESLIYDKGNLEEIAKICRDNNILVVSDEIYSKLTYRGDYYSIIDYYPEGTVVTGGLSKWCGAGGWRLGFCYYSDKFDDSLKPVLKGIASETYSCVAAPVQFAAITAYQQNSSISKFIKNQNEVLDQASSLIQSLIKESSEIRIHDSEGGFYLFLDFDSYREQLESKNIKTAKELCSTIFQDTGVALLPGSAFGMRPSSLTARLAFVDFDGNKALENFANKGEVGTEVFTKMEEGIQALCAWLR